MPNLSDHDLRQMDPGWQERQPEETVRGLLGRALDDLRQARDRLNQNPTNSSRPPGSLEPWRKGAADERAAKPEEGAAHDEAPAEAAEAKAARSEPDAGAGAQEDGASQAVADSAAAGRAGKPVGAAGFGRTQKLAPTQTEEHRPLRCAACARALDAQAQAVAWTGWDGIELAGLGEAAGLRLQVTRHLLMQQRCACGHVTRAQAHRAADESAWPAVDIGQQRLLGPRLAATVVFLCLRLRLSRARVRELLQVLFGLELSVGLIDQTVQQAARAAAPLEAAIVEDLHRAARVHVDETGWPEARLALWLWVFVAPCTALYLIGRRTAEMFDNALDPTFAGTLMTDGYSVYRARADRLRCWAHLLRKLRGLAESSHARAATAGAAMLGHFERLKQAVYAARGTDPPQQALAMRPTVEALRELCERHRDDDHERLREVAREFLLDWAVILRPLAEPHQPLTNNEAERALRHYVIARRISHGTRTPASSRGYALLASVIETCRLRAASAIELLAQAIDAARNGLPAPKLPAIPA
jgi:transposase